MQRSISELDSASHPFQKGQSRVLGGLDRLGLVILMALSLFACLSISRMVGVAVGTPGSTDFHQFWYAGHFVRQGVDPYQAYLHRQEPSVPVRYLDGQITTQLPIKQPRLNLAPTNSAPVVLLLSLFSFFSWPAARALWMACNLTLMALIPWLTIRLFPDWPRDSALATLAVALVFFGLAATRTAVGNGQTSLLVLALMLLALRYVDRPLLAGVLFGLALSKYSLSFPLALYLLYKREFTILLVALAVQAGAVLLLALLSHSSPLAILAGSLAMAQLVAAKSGVHLATQIPHKTAVVPLAHLALSVAVAAGFGAWLLVNRGQRLSARDRTLADLHLVSILLLFGLLAVYHELYDAIVLVLFLALVIYGLRRDTWRLSNRAQKGLTWALVITVVWSSWPYTPTLNLLPADLAALWDTLHDAGTTAVILFSLGLAIWLLHRFPGQPNAGQALGSVPDRRAGGNSRPSH